jgi:Arc/MetJ family transcription regulator
MKTTVDIPDNELADAMKFTRAKTKREAIVTAITEFNRRRRMAELVKHSGSSTTFMTAAKLQELRRKE